MILWEISRSEMTPKYGTLKGKIRTSFSLIVEKDCLNFKLQNRKKILGQQHNRLVRSNLVSSGQKVASSLPLGVNLVGLWLAQRSNWPGGTYWDGGDYSPLNFCKCIDPISIRRGAVYTQKIHIFVPFNLKMFHRA